MNYHKMDNLPGGAAAPERYYRPMSGKTGDSSGSVPAQNKLAGLDSRHAHPACECTRFFAGLELLEPGVVQPQQWRPEPGAVGPPQVAAWCGVARKR
jgi:S-adenosyl methyltransferase